MSKAIFTYPDYGADTSFPELEKRSGQIVTVLNQVQGNDEEVETMYYIRFEDGYEFQAFESELNYHPRGELTGTQIKINGSFPQKIGVIHEVYPAGMYQPEETYQVVVLDSSGHTKYLTRSEFELLQ